MDDEDTARLEICTAMLGRLAESSGLSGAAAREPDRRMLDGLHLLADVQGAIAAVEAVKDGMALLQ
jgi:hypothetical protein